VKFPLHSLRTILAITEYYLFYKTIVAKYLLTLLPIQSRIMQANLLALASKKTIIPIKKCLQFGWETFLKDPWLYVLFTVIGMAANLLIVQIPIVGPFVLFAIGVPLQLGIASFWYFKNQHQSTAFKHFFDAFYTLKELIIFLLLVLSCLLVLLIPLFITVVLAEVGKDMATGAATTDATSWPTTIAILLYSPVILFFSISIVWAPYFIYFYKMSAWQSIKMSYAFIKPRWFSYLLFYLVIVGISIIGAITFVGLLITTPIISLAVFYQFFQLTKLPIQVAAAGDADHEEMMSAELA
jgi:hypothetical protein